MDPVTIIAIMGLVNAYIAPLVKDLISYAIPKLHFSSDDNDEHLKIAKTLVLIQATVNSVERRLVQDEAVLVWLKQLKEAVYDAADVLDEAETSRLRKQARTAGSVRDLINFKPKSKPAEKIKAVRERLEFIIESVGKFALGERMNYTKAEQYAPKRTQTSSFLDESSILGREEDKKKVTNMLLNSSGTFSETLGSSAFVLPIIGIGGVGKTALAQLIYNDERVKSEFPVRMWLHVSDVFDSRRLVLEMLGSLTKKVPTKLTNWNTLQEALIKKLKGQKFLLVLDDLRNEDEDAWESFLRPLRSGVNESKIVVTTRCISVAKMSAMMEPYFLDGLLEEDSWSLFMRATSLDAQIFKQQRLTLFGKRIVGKLHGSPLATRTVGRILRAKPTEAFWRTVAACELWEMEQEEEDILPSLKLSYEVLPPQLKQCFAFCALFPKEYIHERSKLVQMWMGQGYIRSHEKHTMEDIGNDYINELLNKSLLQSDQSQSNCVVMHHLLHDVAQYVSIDDCCRIEDGESKKLLPENLRHLSLISREFCPHMHLEMERLKCLRTLLFFRVFNPISKDNLQTLFSRITCIRVLDLSKLNVKELPENVSKLKLLRYFDVSDNSIKQLPAKLCKLCHLQTLKLNGNNMLMNLPKEMWKLTNLRHLEAASALISKIYCLGRLTFLQELKEFSVSNTEGHTIAELIGLTQIRGSLLLKLLEVVQREDELVLRNKEHLEELILEWSDDVSHAHEVNVECLKPHPNLKVLRIKCYNGAKSPQWLTNAKEKLPNLEQLCLENCIKWELLPPLEDLRFLTSLNFTGMRSIQKLDHSCFGSGFPVLKKLHFCDMPEWHEWKVPNDTPIFPSLSELSIKHCIKLNTLPLLPPALTYLTLEAVGLVSFPEVNNQAAEPQAHPLKTLIIRKCNKLASFTEGCFEGLTCLELLEIEDCPSIMNDSMRRHLEKLITVPSVSISHHYDNIVLVHAFLESLTVLKKLDAKFSIENVSDSLSTTCLLRYKHCRGDGTMPTPTVTLQNSSPDITEPPSCLLNVSSLSSLSIFNCKTLECLSTKNLEKLKQLKSLTITNCEKIKSLGVQSLVSLDHLSIIDTRLELSSLDGLSSSSLKHLKLKSSPLLGEVLRNFTSLERLEIRSYDQLENFTNVEEELARLPFLQSLEICQCNKLKQLPQNLGEYKALTSLLITDCPSLVGLPQAGVPRSLEELTITGCDRLAEQYNMDMDKDKDKIAHVKKVKINGSLIATSERRGSAFKRLFSIIYLTFVIAYQRFRALRTAAAS